MCNRKGKECLEKALELRPLDDRSQAGEEGRCLCSRQRVGSAGPKFLMYFHQMCLPWDSLSSQLFPSSFKKHTLHISNFTYILGAEE